MTIIESLERRRLFSVSLNPATGTLTVQGGAFGAVEQNVLRVTETPTDIVHEFPASAVRRVLVYSLGRTVDFAESVTQDMAVFAGPGETFGYIGTGSGNDAVYANETAADTAFLQIKTGRGSDRVYTNQLYSEVDLGDGNDLVAITGDRGVFAKVYAGAGNDQVYAHGDYAWVEGGAGDDVVVASRRYATVDGGPGSDVLTSLGVFSTVRGGTGNDRIVSAAGSSTGSTYDGGIGYDAIDYSAATVGLLIRNGLSGAYVPDTGLPPRLANPRYDDTLAAFEAFYGGTRDDYIFGDAQSNYIRGNGGNDYIRGNGGDDVLEGNAGRNAVFGDAGNDVILSRNGAADYVHGGTGSDRGEGDAYDVLDSVERRS